MRETWVALDDGPAYPALVSEDAWNGWAVPYFTREVAEEVAAACGGEYIPDEDRFAFGDGPDEETFSSRFLFRDSNGFARRFYPIGAHCWTWSEAPPPTA